MKALFVHGFATTDKVRSILGMIFGVYQSWKVRCGRMRPQVRRNEKCGVRAVFEKVRPHEKKCGECGQI